MVGHLFQGRYRAILCDKDSYLLELVRYLHLNPVRAGLAEDATQYPWSSHAVFLKGRGESRGRSGGGIVLLIEAARRRGKEIF